MKPRHLLEMDSKNEVIRLHLLEMQKKKQKEKLNSPSGKRRRWLSAVRKYRIAYLMKCFRCSIVYGFLGRMLDGFVCETCNRKDRLFNVTFSTAVMGVE